MRVSIELTDEQASRLRTVAGRLGVPVEELARASLVDLLGQSDPEFERVARSVVEKNRELYRRLA